MSPANLTTPGAEIQSWQAVWLESVSQTLAQLGGQSYVVEGFTEKDVAAVDLQTTGSTGHWLRFNLDGEGEITEFAFWLAEPDGLALARLASGGPIESDALFAPEHQEALLSLFQTVADLAGKLWAGKTGKNATPKWCGRERPAWVPAAQSGIRIKGSSGLVITIHLWLRRSNGKYSPEIALPRAEKTDGTPPPLESFSDTNLSLLLDVELEVTLRFGQRQMPLKDILELGPGSVVELDQQVRDPAELLIGRKVVARGNVVVVDGNYGLQITELASPSERMEFLKR